MNYRKELVEICQIIYDWFELDHAANDGANISQYDLLNIKSKVKNRLNKTRNILITEKTKCDETGCTGENK